MKPDIDGCCMMMAMMMLMMMAHGGCQRLFFPTAVPLLH
jgi:hypothetical protein